MGKHTTPPPPTVPAWTEGDRLRKARETTGLDQERFAAQLGVSRGTVSNYERNATTRRRPIVLRAWSLATGVSLEWLEHGAAAQHDGQTA